MMSYCQLDPNRLCHLRWALVPPLQSVKFREVIFHSLGRTQCVHSCFDGTCSPGKFKESFLLFSYYSTHGKACCAEQASVKIVPKYNKLSLWKVSITVLGVRCQWGWAAVPMKWLVRRPVCHTALAPLLMMSTGTSSWSHPAGSGLHYCVEEIPWKLFPNVCSTVQIIHLFGGFSGHKPVKYRSMKIFYCCDLWFKSS